MHPDTKNYTGAVFTLDERIAISESTKQKVNSRRSIESELNVIDDKISKTLLTKRFLECHIFKLKLNIIHQDNIYITVCLYMFQ